MHAMVAAWACPLDVLRIACLVTIRQLVHALGLAALQRNSGTAGKAAAFFRLFADSLSVLVDAVRGCASTLAVTWPWSPGRELIGEQGKGRG